MIKKAVFIVLVLLTAAMLCGCWSYRGVNEMTIIAGMAIDRDPQTGEIKLTFEAIDTNVPIKDQGIKHILIEAEGKTIFDAARNAKKRSINKLYFGHMQVIIISEEITRSENISEFLDWYLRDQECRETMYIVISQEKTAGELLNVQSIENPIISFDIQKIVENDHKNTLSIPYVELYNVFNITKAEGVSLTLPVFHIADNNGKPAVEANGAAIYKGEKMVGTLTPEESKYYLFTIGKVEGGVLNFSSKAEGGVDTALEISRNQTDRSFTYENGEFKILIRTDTDVFLNGYKHSTNDIDPKEIPALETAAQNSLKQSIQEVIKKVQAEYASDIFGFGDMIHKQDFGLWNKFKDNWEETFAKLEVDVECKINIVNTASLKE